MAKRVLFVAVIVATLVVGVFLGTAGVIKVHAQGAEENKPPMASVCTYSNAAMYRQTILVRAADKRLNELVVAAGKQVEQWPADGNEKTVSPKDGDSVEGEEKASANKQGRNMTQQQLARHLQTRLQYTRQVVTSRINQLAGSILSKAYDEEGCTLLLDQDSVLRADQATDLTPAVVEALNKGYNTISFDLLPLPQPQASGVAEENTAG